MKINGKFTDKVLIDNTIQIEAAINRFHKQFHDSILSEEFYFKHGLELKSSDKKIEHLWDLAVYDNKSKSLKVLIDIIFNECYNEAEDDYERSCTVPDGVEIHLIRSNEFTRDFEELIRIIKLDYNEYMEDLFQQCRTLGLPYPNYNHYQLIDDYQKLRALIGSDFSINTRMNYGSKLINHFHKSILETSVNGKPPVSEAWNNDDLLRKVILNRTLFRNRLNPNKILQGFNISKIAPKPSVLSATKAKILIETFLPDIRLMVDPYMGYSGKMLAATSLGISYVGLNPNKKEFNETKNMVYFLEKCKNNFKDFRRPLLLESESQVTDIFDAMFAYIVHQFPEDVANNTDNEIDRLITTFSCHVYLIIVGDTKRYVKYEITTIDNKTHFYHNDEKVLLIPGI